MSGGDEHFWQVDRDIPQCNLEMLKSGLMADVEFNVGLVPEEREAIKAHKYVLVSRSPVFEAMFTANMTENQSNSVIIEDMDPETFKEILRFLYVGVANPDNNNIVQLYHASRKYILPKLESDCICFLRDNLTDTNVFALLDHSSDLDESNLTNSCVKYIAKRYEYLSLTDAFLGITESSLCAILACSSIMFPESAIYQSCIRWAKRKLELEDKKGTDKNIRQTLGEALQLIRFPTMPTQCFAHQVGLKDVLTAEEKSAIYNYLIIKEYDEPECEVAGFSMVPRASRNPAYKVDVMDLFKTVHTWHTAHKCMNIGLVINTPIVLKGFAFFCGERPCVIESISCMLWSSKHNQSDVGQDMRHIRDISSPGGTIVLPVYFDKPVRLEADMWHYLQVNIKEPANAGRRAWSPPQRFSKHQTLHDIDFHFKWKPEIVADPITQLLFSPVE